MDSFGSPVIFKRKEVVAALLPVQDHWLPMSNLDLLLPPLDVGIFFCYKNQKHTGSETIFPQEDQITVNVIKKALANVLVSFYPFAGELVENSLGEPELLCNNRGVDFAEACADFSLNELDLYHPDESIHGMLVPSKSHGVLSIQVTELKCGGLVVGCTFDHRVADAHSANMFLEAWAEIAQSKPITHIPSFRRSILAPRHPGQCDASFDKLYVPISSVPPPPCSDDHLLSRMYYIRAEEVGWLQSSAMITGSKRSKLQSFTAFLWKIIAEGDDDAFKTCRMGVVVDGRERLINRDDDGKTSLPMQNYFGNVLSIPFGEANNEQLKTKSLSQVADMVHEILAGATTEEHFRGLIDWVESHRPEAAAARIYFQTKESNGEAVVVSSGLRFPVDKLDFGWGKPDFGSYHFHWGGETGYVMPMPSASGTGDWVVYMHLSQKHLDLVETKGAHVFRPLTSSYLNF